jgi:lipoprotein-anchoring transpeptidase ErfK/SrfK
MRIRFASLVLLATLGCFAARRPVKRPVKQPTKATQAAPVTAEQVQNATETDPLGPGATGARVLRAQILLDRARFSPGEIDGHWGHNLEIAISGYHQARNEPAGTTIDPGMWALLNRDTAPLFNTYTITADDVKGPFAPVPSDMHEQAQMKVLGWASPQEALGEKFHMSPKLLSQLNPGKKLDTAGEQIVVPNVQRPPTGEAAKVVVSKSQGAVAAYDASGALLALYPATIGGVHDPLPIGNWTVANVQQNPTFYYAPGLFWNVDPNEAKEKLAPGPNNPVGVVWMGLSKRHYGIHGTPEPGRIGHTESHGCIRLTNWDAEELSKMVKRGTPALLEE